MTLIPATTQYSFDRGDRGTGVWAVQRALNRSDFDLSEDGNYGKATKEAVRKFQLDHALASDGVFGPASSAKMALSLEDGFGGVAPGLLRGIVEGESGNQIAAVSHTAPGGIDCGYVQRRVYEENYDNVAVVHAAFDSLGQIGLLAAALKARHDGYLHNDPVPAEEFAWRLAALAHNWPSGADWIAGTGIDFLSEWWHTPSGPDEWPESMGVKFPDGVPVQSPLQWARRYALGAPRHNDPGLVTKYLDLS